MLLLAKALGQKDGSLFKEMQSLLTHILAYIEIEVHSESIGYSLGVFVDHGELETGDPNHPLWQPYGLEMPLFKAARLVSSR